MVEAAQEKAAPEQGQVPCGPVENYIRMFKGKETLLQKTVLGFSYARQRCRRGHHYSKAPQGSPFFLYARTVAKLSPGLNVTTTEKLLQLSSCPETKCGLLPNECSLKA